MMHRVKVTSLPGCRMLQASGIFSMSRVVLQVKLDIAIFKLAIEQSCYEEISPLNQRALMLIAQVSKLAPATRSINVIQ